MATKKDTKGAKYLEPIPREKGEAQKDFYERIRRSARGYKARFTMALRATSRMLDFFNASPSPVGAAQLRESKEDFDLAFNCLQARMVQLLEEAVQEKDFDEIEEDLNGYATKHEDMLYAIMASLDKMAVTAQAQITDPPGNKTIVEEDDFDET